MAFVELGARGQPIGTYNVRQLQETSVDRVSVQNGYGFCAGAAAQDSGLTCQLILVLAGGTADARFAAYNSAPASGYPGLAASDLRGTINLIASVDLTKK